MWRPIDIANQKFGRLTAHWPVGRDSGGNVRWLCSCECGKLVYFPCTRLRTGLVRSCGCLFLDLNAQRSLRKSLYPPEYWMWKNTRTRAKRTGVLFDIEVEDISIPATCPLLGIPLKKGRKRSIASSPSLDRIFPEKGYIKGNVWVISARANAIKNDASIAELELLISRLKDKIKDHICGDTSKKQEDYCTTTLV
jgi:hypothetical protein